MKHFSTLTGVLLSLLMCQATATLANDTKESKPMKLGAFSVSLAVKDIHKSKQFYEQLGFTEAGGNIDENWLILRNDQTTIGLFQGMFENNIMTFNPGWDAQAQAIDSFTDVREIQAHLKAGGIELQMEAEEGSEGPASFVLADPDGNVILIDQHVDAPSTDP